MAKYLSTIFSPDLSRKTSKSHISNSLSILNRFWPLFVSTSLNSYPDKFRHFLLTQLSSISQSNITSGNSSVPFIRIQKFNIWTNFGNFFLALTLLLISSSVSVLGSITTPSTAKKSHFLSIFHLDSFSHDIYIHSGYISSSTLQLHGRTLPLSEPYLTLSQSLAHPVPTNYQHLQIKTTSSVTNSSIKLLSKGQHQEFHPMSQGHHRYSTILELSTNLASLSQHKLLPFVLPTLWYFLTRGPHWYMGAALSGPLSRPLEQSNNNTHPIHHWASNSSRHHYSDQPTPSFTTSQSSAIFTSSIHGLQTPPTPSVPSPRVQYHSLNNSHSPSNNSWTSSVQLHHEHIFSIKLLNLKIQINIAPTTYSTPSFLIHHLATPIVFYWIVSYLKQIHHTLDAFDASSILLIIFSSSPWTEHDDGGRHIGKIRAVSLLFGIFFLNNLSNFLISFTYKRRHHWGPLSTTLSPHFISSVPLLVKYLLIYHRYTVSSQSTALVTEPYNIHEMVQRQEAMVQRQDAIVQQQNERIDRLADLVTMLVERQLIPPGATTQSSQPSAPK